MTDFTELLEREGAILRGNFKLPDGRHADSFFNKFLLLENPILLSPFLEELANILRPLSPNIIAGASMGGTIVAAQVAGFLGCRTYFMNFDGPVRAVDLGAQLDGYRLVIVDDFAVDSRQYDEVLSHVRTRGAYVVALGAIACMPLILNDIPVDPFLSVVRVNAKIFTADRVPDYLAAVPVQTVSGWTKVN